jgi:hypothetical protein
MWEGKEGGAQGKTAFLPPFDRNGGGGGQRQSAGGGRQPSPARWRPGSRGTERGGRGRLVPVLTSGRGGLWREIDDGGRSVTGAACGGRRWELRGERGKCLGGAGRGGERCWAVYRRGKVVSRPGSSTRSSCLPVNGGSGNSAGGIRDGESTRRDATAALLDKTRRAAMQRRASRGSG